MMSDDTHTYDVPIKDADHALFCLREAQRRYAGKLITDDHGMYVVEDGDGIRHIDTVLRALSVRTEPDDRPLDELSERAMADLRRSGNFTEAQLVIIHQHLRDGFLDEDLSI